MAMTGGLSRAEIDHFEDLYGLAVTSSRSLPGGTENTSYVLTGPAGDFVAALLHKRDLPAAVRYAQFLQALSRAGMPVPAYRPPKSGAPLGHMRGKPLIVTEFVHGRCASTMAPRHLTAIGAVLGRLHTSDITCPLEPYIRIGEHAVAAIAALPDPAFADWLLSWHAKVHSAVEGTSQARAPIHGDLFPDNIVIRPRGGITLIDWEDCAQDLPAVDLGMALLGLCAPARFEPARARLLLAGYHSAGAAPIDLEHLFQVTVYVALFTGYQRCLKQQRGVSANSHRQVRLFVESLAAAWPP